MPMAVSASREDMISNRMPFPDRPNDNYISPVLVGCVDYQFTFSPEHHQTMFAYNVCRADPKTPMGLVVKIGDDVLVSNLRLETFLFGGNGAD